MGYSNLHTDAAAQSGADTNTAGENRRSRGSKRSVADAVDRQRRGFKILRTVAVTLVVLFAVAVIAAAGAFAYFRFWAFDDAADVQGTWYVAGTSTPIVIADGTIRLNDEVGYKYTIDTTAKTIDFSLGNLAGGGHYRFSLDRNELSIIDGEFSATDTFFDDAAWTANALISQVFEGEALSSGSGDNTTHLSRTPA